jgi:CRISPR/Cas system CSM-associated protein Csm3 (group 7 of RAMP superfamily)
MQVGHHTSKSFADVNKFLKDLVEKDTYYQQKAYKGQAEEEEEEEEEEYEEPAPQKQASPLKHKSPQK